MRFNLFYFEDLSLTQNPKPKFAILQIIYAEKATITSSSPDMLIWTDRLNSVGDRCILLHCWSTTSIDCVDTVWTQLEKDLRSVRPQIRTSLSLQKT